MWHQQFLTAFLPVQIYLEGVGGGNRQLPQQSGFSEPDINGVSNSNKTGNFC